MSRTIIAGWSAIICAAMGAVTLIVDGVLDAIRGDMGAKTEFTLLGIAIGCFVLALVCLTLVVSWTKLGTRWTLPVEE
jgi:uncharacterized membrane protein